MERKTDSPLLDVGDWNDVLRRTAFSGVDACRHSYDTPEEQTDSLIFTTAVSDQQQSSKEICFILSRQQMSGTDGGFGYAMAEKLAQSLSIGSENIVSLGDTYPR